MSKFESDCERDLVCGEAEAKRQRRYSCCCYCCYCILLLLLLRLLVLLLLLLLLLLHLLRLLLLLLLVVDHTSKMCQCNDVLATNL